MKSASLTALLQLLLLLSFFFFSFFLMLTDKTLKSEYVYSSNISQDTCRKLNLFTCVLSRFSHVSLFGTLWTVGLSGSSVCGILICSHKLSNSIWNRHLILSTGPSDSELPLTSLMHSHFLNLHTRTVCKIHIVHTYKILRIFS